VSDWLWLRSVRRTSTLVDLACFATFVCLAFLLTATPAVRADDQAARLLAQALGAEFNLPVSYGESTVQFLAGRSQVTYRSVWQLPPLYRIEQESPNSLLTVLETPQGTSAWLDESDYLFRSAAGGIQLRLRLLELGGAPIPYVLLSEVLSTTAAATLTIRSVTMGTRAVTVVTARRGDGWLEFWIDQENHFTWKIVQYDRDGELLLLILRSGTSFPPKGTPSLQVPATVVNRKVLQSLDEWRRVALAEQLYRELGSGGALVPWVLLPPLRWIAAETVGDSDPPLVILRIMTSAGVVSLYVQRDKAETQGGPASSSWGRTAAPGTTSGSGWSWPLGSSSWLLPVTNPFVLPNDSDRILTGPLFQTEISGFRVVAAGSVDESLFQQIVRSLRPLTAELVSGARR